MNPIVKWRVISSAIFIHETPNDWDVFLRRSGKRYVPPRLLLTQVLSDEEVWDKSMALNSYFSEAWSSLAFLLVK